jgi:hypothetical protein
VNLRGSSAKHFWDGIEQLDERLAELDAYKTDV